jgi:signal transduction histidine kinase
LFLVKRVVEDQGGRLIFESKPGKGSVFGFAMPIHNKIKIDNTAKRKLNNGSRK